MANAARNSVASAVIWKIIERYFVLGTQLIVQIVIARILEPDEYGVVSMMTVFISISSVFIQNGFNTAVVQKKDADTIDFSTAFIINLLIGTFLYAVLFFAAPWIALFYERPEIEDCLRVLSLVLIIGSVNSIQIAVASRSLRFKMMFKCNAIASLISGVIGISAALMGFGVWALIAQQVSNSVIICIVMMNKSGWKPSAQFSINSAKQMFSFGSKMLLAGLINAIYNELSNLIIGKQYSSSDLAFYTKGKQFPSYITTGIDSSIQSVMLPVFSSCQDNIKAVKATLRKTLQVNSFVVFPLMAFLACSATPLVSLLLTDKWLSAVPFLQVFCLSFAFHPASSVNLQALAAIGKSGVRLKLEFIKKSIGMVLLLVSLPHGPLIIAASAATTSLISLFVNAIPVRRYIGYSFFEQIKDLLPYAALSVASAAIMVVILLAELPSLVTIAMQLVLGMLFYILFSALFKVEGYVILKQYVAKLFGKKM